MADSIKHIRQKYQAYGEPTIPPIPQASSWFYPDSTPLSREEAEKIVLSVPYSAFIVRWSSNHRCYVVTYHRAGAADCKNTPIKMDPGSLFFLEGK